MAKKPTYANIPVAPQPSSLEIRETAQRTLGHLVECLVDHIVLFHQSEESALAACDFAIEGIKRQVRLRSKDFKKKKDFT